MFRARTGKELVVRLSNEVGALNRIAKMLAERGIDIEGTANWVEGEDAVIQLVVDDTTRATDELREHKYDVRVKDVILVHSPHKPGMLKRITDKLVREEIDIRQLYATAAGGTGSCLLVMETADDDRAIVLLNE
ncbi:MAG: hypothetical protein K9N51_02970 [Candidatus Pacebacteria bacterium]|nr:hypothetical protein [Candidatus Paceibacterota bacterium]